MYSPPPPAAAPALRHPDDDSSYISGASQAPASMIAANPWLTPVTVNPLQSKSQSSAVENVSRGSAYAEPPTEQSRVRALQQVSQEDLRFGGEFGHAFGRPEEATMPKLALPPQSASAAPKSGDRGAGAPRWNESEFDRLIREKLEGPHSARTQFKKTVTERAQGHLSSWHWQTLDAVIDGTIAMWEGARTTGGRLLGMVPSIPDAANCKRMNQAKPIVIDLGEDGLPQDLGDDFDETAGPGAMREPIPARIPRAEIPPFTPAGREGLTVMDPAPDPNEEKKTKPKDTASALSVSSKMTSSAAALLGGFGKTTPAAEPPLTEKKVIRPGDSKSCIAPTNAMNSSAASSLGALFAKQSTEAEDGAMTTINEEASVVEEAKAKPKASSKAKSVVVGSSAFSSSAAGALGALTAKSRPETPQEVAASPSSPREAAPKKSAGAKSVLNQSTVMSSSAAGASGLGPKAAPSSAPEAPTTSNPEVESPQPKKSTAAKSVLNQSTVMSSSAAGALGGLLAKAKPPEPAPDASDSPREVPKAKGRPADRQSALAASSVMTSSAAATLGALAAPPKAAQAAPSAEGTTAAPVAKVKSKPKAGQSVISGLNTSSSASALLGPMIAKK